MQKIKGETQTGFTFEIDNKQLANYELIELISEVDANPLVLPRLLKLLLGEQVEALKDHVREDDGTVPVEKLMEEIKDIFGNVKPVKN